MNSAIVTLLFFAVHSLFSLACARKLKQVYKTGNNKLHLYFSNFFYSLSLFFIIIWLPGIVLGAGPQILKICFIIAQFFIFLAFAYLMMVPISIWSPKLKNPAFFIFLVAGFLNLFILPFYYKNAPVSVSGFVNWNLPGLLGWSASGISILVALSCAIFFFRGALVAQDITVKSRSYALAIAAVFLLISIFFFVAEDFPWLPIAYMAGFIGYFTVFLGIYSMK